MNYSENLKNQLSHLEEVSNYLRRKLEEHKRIIKFHVNTMSDSEYKAFEKNHFKVLNQYEDIQMQIDNICEELLELEF